MIEEDSIKKVMSLTVENLAVQQKTALLSYAVGRLREVADLLESGKYEKIGSEYLEFSGSGDGWGNDNAFIAFPFRDRTPNENADDIGSVINELQRFDEILVQDEFGEEEL